MNQNNIDTPSSGTKDKSIGPENRSLAGELVAVSRDKKTNKTEEGKKTIDTLVFAYDDNMGQCVSLYYQYLYKVKINKKIITKHWDIIVEELVKYKTINKLIIATHGAPGQLTFDKPIRLSEAETLFKVTGKVAKPPSVRVIHLEGCKIGYNPISLFDFGRMFNANIVTAYNMNWHVSTRFFESRDVSNLEKWIKPLESYLSPGQPDAKTIAKNRHAYTFYYEWFSNTQNRDLPEKIINLGAETLSAGYYSRKSAKEIYLNSLQEAKDKAKEKDALMDERELIKCTAHL